MLAQVVDGRQEDHRAALRVQAHEPLALQRGERLAHRRRADAEAPRDLDLAQLGARAQLAGEDLGRRRSATRPATVRGAAMMSGLADMAAKYGSLTSVRSNVQILFWSRDEEEQIA